MAFNHLEIWAEVDDGRAYGLWYIGDYEIVNVRFAASKNISRG